MEWYEPCEKLPTNSKPILIDCEEGVGEGEKFNARSITNVG